MTKSAVRIDKEAEAELAAKLDEQARDIAAAYSLTLEEAKARVHAAASTSFTGVVRPLAE